MLSRVWWCLVVQGHMAGCLDMFSGGCDRSWQGFYQVLCQVMFSGALGPVLDLCWSDCLLAGFGCPLIPLVFDSCPLAMGTPSVESLLLHDKCTYTDTQTAQATQVDQISVCGSVSVLLCLCCLFFWLCSFRSIPFFILPHFFPFKNKMLLKQSDIPEI